METNKKNNIPELIVLFGIFILFVLIIIHLSIITNAVLQYVNQPIYTESISYYKCGGTKKQPIMCPIIVKEKIDEEY